MGKVSLHLVQNSKELSTILNIQKKAFKSLYIKYRDTENSPYKESIQDIKRRFVMKNSLYYFIKKDSSIVGYIRILTTSNQTKARISPIAILPQFENRGFGKQTMYEIESLFTSVKEWNLDTIKQETKLLNFYLNLGYTKLEKEEIINDNMVISFFKKII